MYKDLGERVVKRKQIRKEGSRKNRRSTDYREEEAKIRTAHNAAFDVYGLSQSETLEMCLTPK